MVGTTTRSTRARRGAWPLGAILAGTLTFAFTSTTLAAASVGSGEFHPFAAGTGLSISGRAQMVRTADGKTTVSVHVEGLDPNTTYPAHVHQLPCGTSNADGHYRNDPSGPAAPPNEIWPGFTTNDAGIGNGNASVDWTAGQAAVAVVVHAPDGAKIACADLVQRP